MRITDIIILLLFAAIPIWRLAHALRHPENNPAPLCTFGIILSIMLGLSCAAALMSLSLFY